MIEAVLSHAEHLAMPRDTPLKKTLFACDELSGFVHACGLVRPDGLDGLGAEVGAEEAEAAVVRRRRATATRSTQGAELLGLELDEHIRERRRGAAADRAASSGCAPQADAA